MQPDAHPIFIIGSYRSGTSVLTWCIGQHSNILPLEETSWISRLSVDLDYLYKLGTVNNDRSHLGAVGIKKNDFYKSFGKLLDNYMESTKEQLITRSLNMPKTFFNENFSHRRSIHDKKERWIDGTPENSHYVYGLIKMFPNAKFIHIIRNPENVAKSLMHFSTAGARDYAEDEAYTTWLRLTQDCILAEKALGSDKVLRITFENLVNNPKETITKCLEFVGETFDSNCLLPLETKINSSTYNKDTTSENEGQFPLSKKAALDFYANLFSKEIKPSPSLSDYRSLRHKFNAYANSQRPEEIEKLSLWASNLQKEIDQKDLRIRQLETELKTFKPLLLKDYGPKEIMANHPFNRQENGESALWLSCEHATNSTSILFDNTKVDCVVHQDGNLITAIIPNHLTASPGSFSLQLYDENTKEFSNTLNLVVHPS